MARRQDIQDTITQHAARFGLNPQEMLGIAQIESGLNPRNRTGSYKGLFQLDDAQFKRFGFRGGNIYDPEQNTIAAMRLFQTEGKAFQQRTGREPTGFDRYMVHQQGLAGYTTHLRNPDAPAFENFSRASGWNPDRAKRAIWGNMTPEMKRNFPGGVDSVTSKDFLGLWNTRASRAFGQPTQQVAAAPAFVPPEQLQASIQRAGASVPTVTPIAFEEQAPQSQEEVRAFARPQVAPREAAPRTGQFAQPAIAPPRFAEPRLPQPSAQLVPPPATTEVPPSGRGQRAFQTTQQPTSEVPTRAWNEAGPGETAVAFRQQQGDPGLQGRGLPNWAIQAFYPDTPANWLPRESLPTAPAAVPSTIDWMNQKPIFGNLFRSLFR